MEVRTFSFRALETRSGGCFNVVFGYYFLKKFHIY